MNVWPIQLRQRGNNHSSGHAHTSAGSEPARAFIRAGHAAAEESSKDAADKAGAPLNTAAGRRVPGAPGATSEEQVETAPASRDGLPCVAPPAPHLPLA